MTHFRVLCLTAGLIGLLLSSLCGCGSSSTGGDKDGFGPARDTGFGETSGNADLKAADSRIGDGATLDTQPRIDTGETCEDGERRCSNTKEIVECRNNGWSVVALCPDNYICAEGTCVAYEPCTPGTIEGCYSYSQLSVCNQAGTAFVPQPCPGEEKCSNGICKEMLCIPGQAVCDENNAVSTCLDSGEAWTDPVPCEEGLNCVGGKCLSECLSDPKWANSYIGCEYWTVDLDNYHEDSLIGDPPDEAPHALVLSNPGTAKATIRFTTIMQDIPLPWGEETLEAGETRVFEMPRMDLTRTGVYDRSVRVVSNRPVVATQFNPKDMAHTYSNDSSLLLPAEVLGKEYLILSWPTSPLESTMLHLPSQHGYFAVVAVEEGETKVSVKMTVNSSGLVEGAAPLPKGQIHTITLNQFQVLQLQADGSTANGNYDLSGSHVIADKKVAVFSGHEEAVVSPSGQSCCCAEHLEEQLFPLNTWANEYLCVKTRPRGAGDQDVWRIQAGASNITLSTIPPIPGLDGAHLNLKGDYVEVATDKSFRVTATGPIQVAQYLASQECTGEGTGDPALIMGVGISQFRNSYPFNVPEDYTSNYLTAVRPYNKQLTLDGVVVTGPWTELGDGEYEFTYIEVSEGPHLLEGDANFALTQYGFYNATSYGNPVGLNLIINGN